MNHAATAWPPYPSELASISRREGFCLDRFEIYNWGTFHGRVWGLDCRGSNALLTGGNGSGKSTLVDAITTLLVPPQKITYNRAAGAESGERTLRSYVLGHYRMERCASGLAARPVALRDANAYSVILGRFHNEEQRRQVTLAQVFWHKDGQGQPTRLYVVSDSVLSVAEHFANFGSDIAHLRKRLRGLPATEVHESFPPYGAAFRRRFGLENEQALDLFYQTVSMKSVGNLTEFVRTRMLEPFPVEPRIAALIGHFDDLNRAHDAVLQAKDQIGRLKPLVADCDEHARLSAGVDLLRQCRGALRLWFASRKTKLLRSRLVGLDEDVARLADRVVSLQEQRDRDRTARDNIRRLIQDNGGDRIARIEQEVAGAQKEKAERLRRAEQYGRLARALGLPPASSLDDFLTNRRVLDAEQKAVHDSQAEAQNTLTESTVEFRNLKSSHDELAAELRSLRERGSNIPRRMLDLRAALCRASGLTEQALPFVGELVQVRPRERAWEGAIERVLRGFGLSILVADADYARVAEWIDRSHIGERLIYYRMRDPRSTDFTGISPASLLRKIAIKPDSAFYGWLEAELVRRFDYICCDTLEQFRREPRALTRAGQVKAGGGRHEKDDRYRVDDSSRFVLGWSNENKIAALEREARAVETRLQTLATRLAELEGQRRVLQTRLGTLQQLAVFDNFHDLDWQPLALEIERLERERRQLEEGSDVLRALRQQLAEKDAAIQKCEEAIDRHKENQTRTELRRAQAGEQLAECEVLLSGPAAEAERRHFHHIEVMQAEALGEHGLTVDSCDNSERDMREWLQGKIDAEDQKIRRLEEKIVVSMKAYATRYPLDAREADVSVAAAGEYRSMLGRLEADGLPRFEARFKELLNENTIREVTNFQWQLNRERQALRERIDTINRSLHEIDYDPGRYIVIEAEPSTDPDIRDFQRDLRACTEGSLTGSEEAAYSEDMFLQIKRIISRFRGREGTAELDRHWVRKVTDTRNWFTFSASERWREDGREHEHYTDSGGKSGGQKEKLAYTVLAASLAYQFGLEGSPASARSFRFVMIDEAFGHGSDEAARYGLELFQRLGLQLLVVTPLQKINVIEPYVTSVGFVHNEDGRQSLLRNLTIEEYRAERAARRA